MPENSFSQIDTKEQFLQKAIKESRKIISSLAGSEIFSRHFVLDSLDSRFFNTMVFSKDYNTSQTLGRDTVFYVVYFVIQSKDTIGLAELYLDLDGRPLNDYREPSGGCNPELIVGYKRALTNNFKIEYRKAIQLAKERNFNTLPYLKSETDYEYISQKNQTYIKVKYFWSFMIIDQLKGNSVLDINAETGKIDKEEYSPKMPY